MAARRSPSQNDPTLWNYAADRGRLGGPPAPLAERMRPKTLDEVVGQEHLLARGRALRKAIESDRLRSMILWGDPGCGKTTLAKVISEATRSAFEPFSAVLGGVAELREIIRRSADRRSHQGLGTILFVDEIHRFNRSQQDAFLPHVENGTVVLIGATTENPSFSVNAAVLSRAKVFRLRPLSEDDIQRLVRRAVADPERGIQGQVTITDEAVQQLAASARGDARRGLSQLEALCDFAVELNPEAPTIDAALIERFSEEPTLLYDKSGEEHYNVVSALIKSMRGSDPDAAIYWLMRMLEAGDDPLFVLRRLIIFASEDVGNADPRALQVVTSADAAYRRVGMPEGLYPISHACLYLASCPKSNSVGKAFHGAQSAIREHGALPVPNKLRNAPTELMKREGYSAGYQYPHDFDGSVVPGETYLPDSLVGQRFYVPGNQGLEQSIAERLQRIRGSRPEGNPVNSGSNKLRNQDRSDKPHD